MELIDPELTFGKPYGEELISLEIGIGSAKWLIDVSAAYYHNAVHVMVPITKEMQFQEHMRLLIFQDIFNKMIRLKGFSYPMDPLIYQSWRKGITSRRICLPNTRGEWNECFVDINLAPDRTELLVSLRQPQKQGLLNPQIEIHQILAHQVLLTIYEMLNGEDSLLKYGIARLKKEE